MEQILITGSRGFIGTAIRRLIALPFDEIDLSIGSNHDQVKGRIGTLICLSSWVSESESYTNPEKYIENNLVGLVRLLTQNSFDRVIFPSSYAVYDHEGNVNPQSVYGVTKLAAENLVKIYAKSSWILRISNPYGPGDKRSVFYHLAKCKLENREFTLYNLNGETKDFFHVYGLVDVIEGILQGEYEPDVWNIGTGKPLIISRLLKRICNLNNIPYKVVDVPEGLSHGRFIRGSGNLICMERGNLEEEWKQYLEENR